MQPATVHRIHEAPPADAFAHVRLADTLAPQAPASRSIAGTVARWREREAEASILDLGQFPIVEEQEEPSRFMRGLYAGLTLAIFAWLAIGIVLAHIAGRI